VNHLRVFGCIAYALKPDVKRLKMDVKSVKMRFIGYPFCAKGYRLYDAQKHCVVVCRDAEQCVSQGLRPLHVDIK